MIIKQKLGYDFYGCLDYVLSKESAVWLGGNMEGENAAELSQEFQLSVQQHQLLRGKTGTRPTTKAVYHATLGMPVNQKLSDEIWQEITKDYLQQMGFDDNQYVLVRHQDTQHDHVHIVTSVLKLDGSTVSTSWNYYKAQTVARRLEEVYGLDSVPNSWEVERGAPSTGQMRRLRKEQQRYEKGLTDTPPVKPAKVQLQKLIDNATGDRPSLPELINRLEKSLVTVHTRTDANNKPTGIKFCFEGVWFAGHQLGRAYSLPGLVKYKEVVIDTNNQAEVVVAASSTVVKGETANPAPIEVLQSNTTPREIENTQIISTISQEVIQAASDTSQSGEDEFNLAMEETVSEADSVDQNKNTSIQDTRTSLVAPIVAAYLKGLNCTEFEGERYRVRWLREQLVLEKVSTRKQLMKAVYENGEWIEVEPNQLGDAQILHLSV